MATRKSFLLRIDPDLYAALERWAADDLRSVNGHIEYLLHQAVDRAGRSPKSRRSSRRDGRRKAEEE